CAIPYLLSFPTRRSSDLGIQAKLTADLFFIFLLAPINQFAVIIFREISIGLRIPYLRIDPVQDTKAFAPLVFKKIFQPIGRFPRSEEHTSELQSRENLVC